MMMFTQSRTQSPQASWSVGGRQERLWGNGIVTAGILRLTILSFVTVNSQSKHQFFFPLPQSLSWRSPTDQED